MMMMMYDLMHKKHTREHHIYTDNPTTTTTANNRPKKTSFMHFAVSHTPKKKFIRNLKKKNYQMNEFYKTRIH